MTDVAPIFVVGFSRSGTTLLSHLLDRHSAIAATPETNFAVRLRFALEPFYRHGVDATLDEAFRHDRIRDLEIDRQRVAEKLEGKRLTSATLFEALLATYMEKHAASYVVEKSPGHSMYVDLLAGWFPKARFIWIVRDGRACIASLRKLDYSTHDPFLLSWRWSRNISYIVMARRKLAGQIYDLRYEDLVRDPDATMNALHQWLDIPFEPGQVVADGTTAVVPENEKAWKGNVGQPIDAGRAAGWTDAFDPGTLSRVNRMCGVQLRRLGYDAPEPGAVQRILFVLLYSQATLRLMRWGEVLRRRLRHRLRKNASPA